MEKTKTGYTDDNDLIEVKDKDEFTVENDLIYASDPCYLFAHEGEQSDAWSAFGDVIFSDDTPSELRDRGILVYRGAEIFYSTTAHGDGTYPVTGLVGTSKTFVDAGLISIADAREVEQVGLNPKDKFCGTPIGETDSVSVKAEYGVERGKEHYLGNIRGDVEIITDGSDRR